MGKKNLKQKNNKKRFRKKEYLIKKEKLNENLIKHKKNENIT